MYPNREVFPNTPLALVVTEIRFTDSPRLRQQETLDAVAIALEERFPVSTPQTNVTFNIANLGPGVLPQVAQERRTVLMNTAKTESVTITPSSFIYETTAYREFDDLCAGVTAVCEALIDANVRPALVRVGLRYVDEVRVPEPITDVRAWGKWIDASVIGPLTIGPDGVTVRNAQGLVTFDLGDGKGFNFQYSALDQPPVVQPQLLNRQKFEPGPFFVLDFDGFRDFNGEEEVVRLDVDEVTNVLTAVHDPVGAAFQRAITEDARNLFRGAIA
ncbi:TIGR04255 family protein [Mycobacterium avium]|jgi:uncharacterized protein (TIGR04255 family)|uniref:TIGR04255 family protein n=1 Tax=Mycobacterium avium TaxID=1764 RepID=UPI00045AD7E7|nr:TIGR04255 family protein [Mycobacterium avium]KBR62193.1 hypothetical protein X425_02746 [Mycobacterium avium XTB13-223]MCA2296321.1 TIGR04255 family protein [Mycobacterium avium]MCA4761386.1 TIGR04255 family protein [Mycobacterium avium subsp. hominissuis]MDO2355752.1 TIGR04255 family protein [Mycobacterium avium subsp. hominissuis]MDV3271685.1 TIGR04255 family protein [Mycobacterium avium]